MKELIERIEELLILQQRLVNVLFLSGARRAKLSVNTAFDLLYHNIELLDLMEALLSSQEELAEETGKNYALNLFIDALSWMALVLPVIEDECPIFLQGIAQKEKEPFYRIRLLRLLLEDYQQRGDYHSLLRFSEELHSLSSMLKHQILLARRAYLNLA